VAIRILNASLSVLFVALFAATAHGETIVLPPNALWEYTFTSPVADPTWNTTTGTGGTWSSGAAPFGNCTPANCDTLDFESYNTLWPADDWGDFGDDLWVRTSIELSGGDLSAMKWFLGADNGFALFANGMPVASDNAEGYTFRWEYEGGFAGTLRPGHNVIALALEDHGGATAFNMQIVTSPGTPAPVPEPGTLILTGSALGLLAARSRPRKR